LTEFYKINSFIVQSHSTEFIDYIEHTKHLDSKCIAVENALIFRNYLSPDMQTTITL